MKEELRFGACFYLKTTASRPREMPFAERRWAAVLEKLSGDAVEPDQLAQLHDLGLSQPLRPAQIPGGAEVEWWKLGSMVLGDGRAL